MGFSKQTTAALAILAAQSAGAHMFLATPIRFAQPVATNGPLLPDGSNWPCQSSGGPYVAGAQMNVFPLGSKQPLAFIGGATHAGGSCQISLTYDTAPNKNSVWKVIKSIEGGCPAKDQVGNIGGDAAAPDPYTYTFDVPNNIPVGNVTVQWTWMNKVGNREMYAQCAPVVLTGSGGSKSNYDSLPDVFKANIGNNCGTVPDKDVLFPNPGPNVERLNGATTAFADPTGAGCEKPSGGSQAKPTNAAPATPQPPVSSAPAHQVPPPAATSAPAGGFVTAPPVNKPTTKAQPAPPPPAATTAAANPGSGSGSSGAAALSGACTTVGEYNCIGGTSFQQCASGVWSVAIPVAAGTKCSGGRGSVLNIVAVRAVRFSA